jgi:peptidylprolyl isomerase
MGVQRIVKRAAAAGAAHPAKGQTVTVNCTGMLSEGRKKFWSTHDTNTPFSFTIGQGQVIKGWDEGVMQMQQGEVSELVCSPDYAYGPGGFPAWGIPPNAELIFEVELLSAK